MRLHQTLLPLALLTALEKDIYRAARIVEELTSGRTR